MCIRDRSTGAAAQSTIDVQIDVPWPLVCYCRGRVRSMGGEGEAVPNKPVSPTSLHSLLRAQQAALTSSVSLVTQQHSTTAQESRRPEGAQRTLRLRFLPSTSPPSSPPARASRLSQSWEQPSPIHSSARSVSPTQSVVLSPRALRASLGSSMRGSLGSSLSPRGPYSMPSWARCSDAC
eukprot:TRINITY_DN35016_c0_g1_i1.p1 TRINITY_DN35016_c0_g1~~TRINITY_DN35016_c0_g1_i1.p1  ORF type:complete len:179 (+),score=18.30 TRINITY_DN35016_c0_g1_i1:74-610(+)